MDIFGSKPVWKVIADVGKVTESQARKICQDFTDVGLNLPADGLARNYEDMIIGICDSLSYPDIRETMLNDAV